MRARYYSPEMKRFINADIVAGQISNAITLNRFAYANGNPVSFVDPFGLSAERGIIYENELYKFFDPSCMRLEDLSDWTKIDNIPYESIQKFNWAQFVTDLILNLDDLDGFANGEKAGYGTKVTKNAALFSLASGILSAISNNKPFAKTRVNFEFFEKDEDKLVLVTTGNDRYANLMQTYAGTTYIASLAYDDPVDLLDLSYSVKRKYEQIVGGKHIA